MKKILVFMADGCEEVEALTPVDILRRAGMHVDMVSVMGKEIVESSRGVKIVTDISIDEVNYNDYDGFILPGGAPGYINLKESQKTRELTIKAFNDGKLVAAICASPTVLGDFGILKGKKACCYPGMEDGMKGATPNDNMVTVDGNIITSRGMGTSIEFSLTIVEYFTDKKTSVELGDTFVWKRP